MSTTGPTAPGEFVNRYLHSIQQQALPETDPASNGKGGAACVVALQQLLIRNTQWLIEREQVIGLQQAWVDVQFKEPDLEAEVQAMLAKDTQQLAGESDVKAALCRYVSEQAQTLTNGNFEPHGWNVKSICFELHAEGTDWAVSQRHPGVCSNPAQ